MYQRLMLLIVFLLVSGCTILTVSHFDKLFGPEHVQQRLVSDTSARGSIYLNEVKPVLEQRCVVCHGCYDAPCQLKLSSPAGIDRGLSKAIVYDGARLIASDPTRLGIDATSTAQWREKGFTPVLNERSQTAKANQAASVFYQSLLLKKAQSPVNNSVLGDEFSFSLDRAQSCPTAEAFGDFAKQQPHAGMPYGLPAISSKEFSTLTNWVKHGSKMAEIAEPNKNELLAVAKWEAFLNLPDNKHQLTARYIFEHWYLAHIYFPDASDKKNAPADFQPTYFQLIRSSTPPGQAIVPVTTRRPYEDPKVAQVYYRLQHEKETILAKTHLPLALNDNKLDRIKQQFISPAYNVTELPSYEVTIAANPFKAFEQLPVKSRYQFMLDEAQLLIMGFIKGPVCRGQIALNVINDNFWVVFVDPDMSNDLAIDTFLTSQKDMLALPSEAESNASAIFNWVKYANRESEYIAAKAIMANTTFADGENLNEQMIWQGDNYNQNAALTIFRHNDSATVVKGLVGENPKTAWVMDYPMFERIHYLLVAGFDVYGNVGHQLTTRLYMDFLRIEGEKNFLALLPLEQREAIHNYWYRNTSTGMLDILDKKDGAGFNQPSGIEYHTADPQTELYGLLKNRLAYVLNQKHQITVPTPLISLNKLPANIVNLLPQVSFILVANPQGEYQPYTLLHHNAHFNISSLLNEENQRDFNSDTALLVAGFIGDYPQAIWHITEDQQAEFVAAVSAINTEMDYQAVKAKFGIRRTHPDFWHYSDLLHQVSQKFNGVEYGLFDYNRLENR